MASGGGYGAYHPYYQPAAMPYYYNYAQQAPAARGGGGGGGSRGPSVHLFVFLATLFLFAATSMYARCEEAVESMVSQLRPLLILSPLLLIAAVQLWAASSGADRRGGGGALAYLVSQMTGDHHRTTGAPYVGAASSPWGVALVLVLVLFLVSCQSSFQDWRFLPLRRR